MRTVKLIKFAAQLSCAHARGSYLGFRQEIFPEYNQEKRSQERSLLSSHFSNCLVIERGAMIRLVVFSLVALAATVSGEYCYNDVVRSCGAIGGAISNCNSNYSGVESVIPDLQHFTATHIDQNFQLLLMSAYFNNYEANREGFSKLYRKMADDAWEDAIDLIKYMAKRGFNMNYNIVPRKKVKIQSYKMYELSSLATALDMQKVLAEQAHEAHSEVTVRKKQYHDAEVINFLEQEFVSKHADKIHALAGHANDLHQLIAGNKDPSLAIYLFDEHLKKVVG